MSATEDQVTWAVSVAPASVAEMKDHGQTLMYGHAKELEPDLAPMFNPDWDAYWSLEADGVLVALGAWAEKQGEPRRLIGYAAATVLPSIHYSYVMAHHDVLYVANEWRRRGVGVQLLRQLIRDVRSRGARRLIMHAKPGSTFALLLERMGFIEEEVQFRKDL